VLLQVRIVVSATVYAESEDEAVKLTLSNLRQDVPLTRILNFDVQSQVTEGSIERVAVLDPNKFSEGESS
jgi:hypothetical protein